MAQNNYFGFTHGGTQYGSVLPPNRAAAYQTGQAGYAVSPAATAATYTQRPAAAAATGYETYQAAAAAAATGTTYAVPQTYDYGYGRAAPAATYDATKTYYQQPAAAATYTTTETHYQAAKPAYSTTSAYAGAPRQATTTGQAKTYQATSTAYPQTNPSQNTSYTSGYSAPAAPAPAPAAAANKAPGTAYSGYDAALYSAATMYVAQQQSANTNSANQKPGGWQSYRKGFGAGGGGGNMKAMRPKQPPKPQQLHYCDVCKISCAGPQTYREHLEGQKHKKKEASLKVPQQPPTRGAGNSLRCELCDVTCTGNDAYAAHIRGAKHQKVVKLHTKLGKPIPSADPTVLNPKPGQKAAATTTAKKGVITATPKINFIASGNLGTVNQPQEKIEETDEAVEEQSSDDKDIQPVGQEYIEENKSEDGKIISFNCKLCECRFNDPNAKDMHMKGRRHRFAYKKKVNPDLVVDMKPSLKQRKMLEEKLRQQQMREEFMRRRDEMSQIGPLGPMGPMCDEEMMYWEERRRYEEDFEYYEWYRRYGRGPGAPPMPPRPFPGPPPGMMMFPGHQQRRPDSSDDKHVIAHHSTIYPKEEELQAVQKIVSHTEKALKFVSDSLADSASPTPNTNSANANSNDTKKDDSASTAATTGTTNKKNQKEDGSDGNLFSFQKEKEDSRILRGVMRVGNLAKGLLLSGDNHVCLVVLCAEKPTRTLLNKVAEILPAQLKSVAPEESYNVGKHPESAAITVSGGSVTVSVTLTSPLMRDPVKPAGDNAGQQQGAAQQQTTPATPAASKPDPPDVLPKAKCLEALAALRHAKWFQARATALHSCVMVIRIMRDLCNRVPTWGPLNPWALELLTEKVLSTAGVPLSPGAALRRLLECVAGGIILPGSPGLADPCEKDPVDAIGNITPQQREDITASAQHALRLVAFRQIHKVLGMEQLPPPKHKSPFTRKRRRDNSNGESTDSEAVKKDKKTEEIKMETDSK
ncbi:zinc finger RNA-binding protein isoform X1 [Trichogramma pretiosum]|uniref:zinc finger RNA-binding protein isoform X1 n=1 Tax=Trichogramma pretiosum TaxID=7493 RepID=UPI0006C9C319|nr:zinc finger RNA-binding protein isoform X1 [Trichogramma pretiosum]